MDETIEATDPPDITKVMTVTIRRTARRRLSLRANRNRLSVEHRNSAIERILTKS
jgi:hypothetical protein